MSGEFRSPTKRYHVRYPRKSTYPCRALIAATILAPALLAQLVEHLHGKEGVSGSSPEEGLAEDRLVDTNPASGAASPGNGHQIGDRSGVWLPLRGDS